MSSRDLARNAPKIKNETTHVIVRWRRLHEDGVRHGTLPRFLSRSSSSIGITSTGMSMAPVFQSTLAGSGSDAIASKAVAVAAFAPTCAEHQTRQRNDPRHREMDTS